MAIIGMVIALIIQFVSMFTIGAVGYGCIEVLWRGYTHWTMLIAGGISLTIIYYVANYLSIPNIAKYLLCGMIITGIELLIGLIVNRYLGWGVWDYSAMKFNVLGQICPIFSCAWVLLSIPGVALCKALGKYVF